MFERRSALPRFVGARCRETNRRETTKRHRQRQDAARLSLCPVGADRPQFCSRLPARTDAGGDAPPRRLWREIHDRLRKGISALLVRARQARRRQARLRAELFRRRRQPAAVGMAPQGLDLSGRSARLVPMVLPLLSGPPHAGRGRAADQALESHAPACAADRTALRAGRSRPAARANARRCCTGPTTAGEFDGAGGCCPLQSVIGARGHFTKYCQFRYRPSR